MLSCMYSECTVYKIGDAWMKLDCIHYLTAGCVGPQTFLSERAAFLREHHNGMYCVSVYYLCRMIAEVSNATSPFFFHMTYTSNESKTAGTRFTKYLTTILRLSYDNAKVTIDLRRTSNLQNILRRTQGFSYVQFTCKIVRSSKIMFVN